MPDTLQDIVATGTSVFSPPVVEGIYEHTSRQTMQDVHQIIADQGKDFGNALWLFLVAPLLVANIILYGLLFVNVAERNWNETIIANSEQ
jgi:hypothetical protein